MLKVLLIVVQGKPEGKPIPVTKSVFRVGRDEGCDLRPNSVEVSRNHCEIEIKDDAVFVRDLGSRNGTKVNDKLLTEPHKLKSGELLRIGPLTFAVSISGEAAAGAKPVAAGTRGAGLDDVKEEVVDSWLVADNARPTPDRQSAVYDGDTVTLKSYKGTSSGTKSDPDALAVPLPETEIAAPVEPEASSDPAVPVAQRDKARPQSPYDENLEFESVEEGAGDLDDEASDEGGAPEKSTDEMPEEMIDESNPFYAAKKAQAQGPVKPVYKDSSDAATDILKKMLERRRASRST